MSNVNERCAVLSSAAMVTARCARLYGTDDSGIPEMANEIIALRTAEQSAAQVSRFIVTAHKGYQSDVSRHNGGADLTNHLHTLNQLGWTLDNVERA